MELFPASGHEAYSMSPVSAIGQLRRVHSDSSYVRQVCESNSRIGWWDGMHTAVGRVGIVTGETSASGTQAYNIEMENGSSFWFPASLLLPIDQSSMPSSATRASALPVTLSGPIGVNGSSDKHGLGPTPGAGPEYLRSILEGDRVSASINNSTTHHLAFTPADLSVPQTPRSVLQNKKLFSLDEEDSIIDSASAAPKSPKESFLKSEAARLHAQEQWQQEERIRLAQQKMEIERMRENLLFETKKLMSERMVNSNSNSNTSPNNTLPLSQQQSSNYLQANYDYQNNGLVPFQQQELPSHDQSQQKPLRHPMILQPPQVATIVPAEVRIATLGLVLRRRNDGFFDIMDLLQDFHGAIEIGDMLSAIQDASVYGKTYEEVSTMLVGPHGATTSINVVRALNDGRLLLLKAIVAYEYEGVDHLFGIPGLSEYPGVFASTVNIPEAGTRAALPTMRQHNSLAPSTVTRIDPGPNRPSSNTSEANYQIHPENVRGEVVISTHPSFALMQDFVEGFHYISNRKEKNPEAPLMESDFQSILRDELKSQNAGGTFFVFKEYAPRIFIRLRSLFGITIADMLTSMCAGPFKKLGSPGMSSSSIFFPHDSRFLIKSISPTEASSLIAFLPSYIAYMNGNPKSMLPRYYGLYRIKNDYGAFTVMVTENLLYTPDEIHTIYDLKGTRNRRMTLKTEADLRKSKIVLNDSHYLDNNESISMFPAAREAFLQQLRLDAHILSENMLYDYSLLICIHSATSLAGPPPRPGLLSANRGGHPVRIYVGVIDTLMSWSTSKSAASFFASIARGNDISACPPPAYASRFVNFIEKSITPSSS